MSSAADCQKLTRLNCGYGRCRVTWSGRLMSIVSRSADVLVEEPEAAVHVGGAAAGRIPGEAEARSEVVFVAAPLVTLVEGDLEGKAAVASELVLDPLK